MNITARTHTAVPGEEPVGPTSGLLIVDKPQGVTSHDVVAAARGALHTKKVGHAGTLDPMATGVLVIGFGNATRLLNYIVDHDKTYEATIRLGAATTTDDADGELLELGDEATPITALSRELIEHTIADHLTGHIQQVPNAFSAIKINGQRAYDLAREGKDVELTARPVTIHEFTVLDMRVGYTDRQRTNGPLIDCAQAQSDLRPVIDLDVRVSCSAGTYIRALGRDLGALLGSGAYLTRLRRTRVGRFDVTAANVVTAHAESRTFTNRAGETVTRNRAVLDLTGDELRAHALTMVQSVREAMPTIAISAEDAANLRFGRRIAYDVREATAAYVPGQDECDGDVAAIVDRAKRGEAKPIVVFPA
ncbi:pseudouridine synthase [Bifidobacterium goeldii]|uniref:tRNA pseudouridine synthase B n=1 Tax=Bifidobacterium goeldii TaxID=2306975 RepID=A0A430FJ70_9BIFI|nr:pseudouridine synthase [Bifidobacterium goeldii]